MQVALACNPSANSGWFPTGDNFVFAPTQPTFAYHQNIVLQTQAEPTPQTEIDISKYFDFDAAS